MKRKIWFQTDLGYKATITKLQRSGKLFNGYPYLGRYSFRFKNLKDITYQITAKGKVGIFYPESFNPQQAIEQLQPYLVKADGSPAQITGLIEVSEKTQKLSDKPSKLNVWQYLKWKQQYEDERQDKLLEEFEEKELKPIRRQLGLEE